MNTFPILLRNALLNESHEQKGTCIGAAGDSLYFFFFPKDTFTEWITSAKCRPSVHFWLASYVSDSQLLIKFYCKCTNT